MKPILLKIKGINSFLEEQSIDFESLTQGGIFGIFGPTGSGKSTILDGITLALYGKMARNSANYIHVNAERGAVVFDFSISGSEKKIYRASREFVRNKEGGIKQMKCQLLEIRGKKKAVLGDKATEVTLGVEKIIGLGWQDFVRTVVLPQGKFSEFLKLKGTERRDMLERLFNLSQYGEELSQKLKKERIHETEGLHRLEGEYRVYQDVDKTIFDEKKDLYETIMDEVKKSECRSKELKKEFEKIQYLWEQKKEIENALKEKEILDLREKEFSDKEEKLRLGKKVFDILEPMETLDQFFLETEKKKQQVKQTLKEIESLEQAWIENEKKWVEIEKEKNEGHLQLVINASKTLECIELFRIKEDLDKEISELVTQYNLEVGILETYTKKREVLFEEKENTEKSLREKEIQEKEMRISLEDRGLINQGQKLQEKIVEVKKNINAVEEEKRILLERIKESENEKFKLEKKKKEVENQEILNLEEVKHLETSRPKTREEIQVYKDEKFTALLRENLVNGKPCPVCGSEVHFIKKERTQWKGQRLNIDQEIREMIDEIEAWEKKKGTLEIKKSGLEKEILVVLGEIKGKDLALEELKKQYQKKTNDWKLIREDLETFEKKIEIVSKESNVNNFIEENIKIRKVDATREKLISKIEALRVSFDKEREEYEKILEEISRIKESLREKQTRCSEKKSQRFEKLKAIELKGGKNKGISDLLDQNKAIEKEIQRISNEWIRIREIREKLRIENQEAQRKVATDRGILNTMKAQGEERKKSLTKEIEALGFFHWSEAQRSALSKNDMIRLEKEIQDYKDASIKIKGKLETLENKMNGQMVGEETYQEIKGQWEKQIEENEELKKRATQLEDQVNTLRRRLKEKKAINLQIEKKNEILGLIGELEGLFKGKKFVEFVAVSRLKYIAIEASKRLSEISQGNYGLETDNDGHFLMRDFKNGGVPRDPSTLSGGETFLASLALALALSSEIQLKGAAPLEFFFLDEGFGSLHEDALDVVMNSMERLHHNQLKVGIISHVESIKNRMPVKLILTPGESGVGGSHVRIEK
ncbi:MAG: AAA family ATPase [Eubacteriaceae bacterium]